MSDVTQKLSVDLERVFPVEQREAAKFLQEHIFPELPENHFFLVGGTALALRFGHRQSIDLLKTEVAKCYQASIPTV